MSPRAGVVRALAGAGVALAVIIVVAGCHPGRAPPHAQGGVLDLRAWDFERDGPVSLSGQWELAWGRLLVHDRATDAPFAGRLDVPSNWAGQPGPDGAPLPASGCATLRLRVLLPAPPGRPDAPGALAVSDRFSDTASAAFAQGPDGRPVPLVSIGRVGCTAATTKARESYAQATLPASTSTTVVLWEEVANFELPEGGPGPPLLLGTPAQLAARRRAEQNGDYFLTGLLLVVGFYHLMIWAIRREERAPLWLGLVCLLIMARTFERGGHLQELFPDADLWLVGTRIAYTSVHLATPVFSWYLYEAIPGILRRRFVIAITWWCVPLAVFSWLTPATWFGHTKPPWQAATVVTIFWLLFVLVRGSVRDATGTTRLSAAGFLALGAGAVHDILINLHVIDGPFIVGYGQAFFVLCQAVVLARGVARARRTAEELSQRLLHLDQLKNEFLANVSHELRTPLNAIINIPEALLGQFHERAVLACDGCGASFEDDDTVNVATTPCGACDALRLRRERRLLPPDDSTDLAARLRSVSRSGRHLLAVVNDVLDHSKLVAQRFTVDRVIVDVDELVARAVEHTGPVAQAAHVVLHADVPKDLRVYADPLRVVQVLVNLLANAVKFSPAGAVVDLTAARDGGDVVLRVVDRGPGIAPEHHGLIFEAYRQVDSGHTRKHGGTGLGLSIVKQIVELHGGTVSVDSAVGAGATFVVRLPGALPPST